MRAETITDAVIQEPDSRIVIELGDGRRLATSDYYHSLDKRGGSIIVIKAGKDLRLYSKR